MERVEELMTVNKFCCSVNDELVKVSKQMAENNCSEIFIIDNESDRHPLGVVSEHDIMSLCSKGINPLKLRAVDCMRKVPIKIPDSMPIEDCMSLLEYHKLEKAPVIDQRGGLCGTIALSDMVPLFND